MYPLAWSDLVFRVEYRQEGTGMTVMKSSSETRRLDRTVSTKQDEVDEVWPALPYDEWKDTLDTLHMWTQVVGKVKLELVPFLNDWWQVAFMVTARGLTTASIPYGRRVFQVDFDFLGHRLDIHVSDGSSRSMHLNPRSVAD